MERSDAERPASEDGNQLNRNRSFKSKQLVRSQAIRESTSPPRTISPAYPDHEIPDNVTNNVPITVNNNTVTNNGTGERTLKDECGSVVSCDGEEAKKQPVEIQITGGNWDSGRPHRQRSGWSHSHHSEPARDLLSNNPRVACVCGACAHCPHCRGRRRRHVCPIKQDSGIACSEDCPDCADSDIAGSADGMRKSVEEAEEQTYYCRCPDRKEKPKNLSLSRTDSDDRSEPTGPELVNFIKETLNKNARDRATLLKIEKELHGLINDTGRCIVRFPVMTSYGRMLVHRCAALFQLSHHLDQANKTSVLVSKSGTSGGRIPCTSFKQWCTAVWEPSPQRQPTATHAKSILKRDTHSLDEAGNGSLANSRSKSLEQREKDYERMKRRIFSADNCTQDESQWPWLSGPVKLLTPETGRNKLLKVQSLESSSGLPPRGGAASRRGVSKSHSFGGYAQPQPQQKPLRLLSRQGDLASSSWRLSPSSSGYKTLSLRSTDSVTPSPTGGASPEPCCAPPRPLVPGGSVVWCVSDMARVPRGAWLLHPRTGRPLSNPDGSVYRYDPDNPPVLDQAYPEEDLQVIQTYDDQESQIDQNDKKRGKLEKQHSFIDHGECDCVSNEDAKNKCYCDARHDSTQRKTDKNMDEKQSPCKNSYDQETEIKSYETSEAQKSPEQQTNYDSTNTQSYSNEYENYERYDQRQQYEAPTNHRPPYEAPPNHKSPYEAAANQKPAYEAPPNQRTQQFETTNQRAQNEQASKLTNQDSQDIQYNQYGQVRTEEVTSPPQGQYQQELTVQGLAQAKGTPGPVDHNMRSMSINNVYPAMPQGYPYMTQCRADQTLQPLYPQTVMVSQAEEQKQMTSSPHQEPTFRIDPSYPYAPLDYAAQCGACVDPNTMRSYNVPYGQMEMQQQVLPQAYPVGNVLLPQQHLQTYPYQETVQWAGSPLLPLGGKLLVPEPYPALCRQLYQCGFVYPPVIPQPYQVCQPLYGAVDTPTAPPPRVPPPPRPTQTPPTRRNSDDIAVKIQQIKEQMAEMNTRDNKDRGGAYNNKGREEWRKRNNGSGILGSYPHNLQGRTRFDGRPTNDDTQLTSAARAIVNSIRNMQAKNNYHDNRRPDYAHFRSDRPDFRPRRDREPDRQRPDKPDEQKDERRFDRRNAPFQYRPPYLLRQMSPNTWCRRSPAPVHPVLNHPRRPHPDTRNPRR